MSTAHSKFWLTGAVLLPGTALLVGRFVYEQTYLTWLRGPQMVGFSLAHSGGLLFLIALACFLLSHLWLLGAFIYAIVRRQSMRKSHWLLLSLTCLTLLVNYVPYNTWQSLVVKMWGPGPAAEDLLVYGAGEGNTRLVEMILADGYDVNSKGNFGYTPLHFASSSGDERMVSLLLERGADTNARTEGSGLTPLMRATEEGHLEVVKLLLNKGARAGEEDSEGHTALVIARRKGRNDIAELLSRREFAP
ncbi:MAG: ankyrin repeat domain-containing protein [Pyrinomonadaceae bacterium]